MDIPKFADNLLGAAAHIAGPLKSGHYIQVGTGLGFYVPEADFERVQALANQTGKIQFLGVTRDGAALLGTRDEILAHPDSAGLVAWIAPQTYPDMHFVAIKSAVMRGAEHVATAISKTMAKRIANALNKHKPNSEGV